jgi:hypothetical protein
MIKYNSFYLMRRRGGRESKKTVNVVHIAYIVCTYSPIVCPRSRHVIFLALSMAQRAERECKFAERTHLGSGQQQHRIMRCSTGGVSEAGIALVRSNSFWIATAFAAALQVFCDLRSG